MRAWEKKAFGFLDSLQDHKWPSKIDPQKTWEKYSSSFLLFVNENGRLPSGHAEEITERSLGRWAQNMRQDYRDGKLSIERQKFFESIPGWNWKIDLDKIWMQKRELINTFLIENNRYPSSFSQDEKEKSLSFWISLQRNNYKKNCLSLERIKSLEYLPDWTWEINDKKWKAQLEACRLFVIKENRYPISRSSNKQEKKLGNWIAKIRKLRKKGELSIERQRDLESIPGWKWEVQNQNWKALFEYTKSFINLYNKMPSRSSNNKIERKAGKWIRQQRSCYEENKLSTERQNLLESIPNWKW